MRRDTDEAPLPPPNYGPDLDPKRELEFAYRDRDLSADGGEIDYSTYANPMQWSIHHRTVNIEELEIDVDEIEIVPSEGTVYVHWSEP